MTGVLLCIYSAGDQVETSMRRGFTDGKLSFKYWFILNRAPVRGENYFEIRREKMKLHKGGF